MAVIALDRDELYLARAIVDRERPTPQQETRFEWTTRLILTTILLMLVWVVTAISSFYHYQQFLLFAAVLTCLAAVTLFTFNAGFVTRLGRSFLTAKRLGVHWRHSNRTWKDWARLACLAVIQLPGYPLLFIGVVGLGSGIYNRKPDEFLAALPLASFGLGCVFLLPIEIVRQRVNGMRALRGALNPTLPAGGGNVPVREYDHVTDLQFQHIIVDSLQSLANVETDGGSAVRLSPAFQEAVADLPEAQSDLVYDLIGDLDGRSELANAAPGGDILMPVPDTTLQIRLQRHPLRNEIEVVALEAVSPQAGPLSHG